jgi:hypothetical protein
VLVLLLLLGLKLMVVGLLGCCWCQGQHHAPLLLLLLLPPPAHSTCKEQAGGLTMGGSPSGLVREVVDHAAAVYSKDM